MYQQRRVRPVLFLDDIDAIKGRYPDRFSVFHILSREDHAVPLFNGRVDEAKLELLSSEYASELARVGAIDDAYVVLVDAG